MAFNGSRCTAYVIKIIYGILSASFRIYTELTLVCRCSPPTGVDPYGTGGDTSPQYLDWGDINTNVPLQYF